MPGLQRPAHSWRRTVTIGAVLLAASGCSNKQQRLGEYDFRGRTLAVITIAPPHPELLGGSSLDVDADQPVQTLLRLGSAIAREASAIRVRPRLDSAATAVDVSRRMAERTLQNAARHLRATPVENASRADYELEIRVRHYGIIASSWDSNAYFSIDADMLLLDGSTGRRIWSTEVRGRDPVRSTTVGVDDPSITDAVTAMTLARMSAAEIERALESLADFCADLMVQRLAESLDDARG